MTATPPSSRLVLVGAGDAGREVAALVRTCPTWLERHGVTEIVFIDDVVTGPDVVSTVQQYEPRPSDLVLCTVNTTRARRDLTRLLAERGATFTTFVHDSAVVFDGALLGPGAIVYPNVVITAPVTIGAHAFISTGAVIAHDVVVGDHVTLCGYAQLLGHVVVGDRAYIGSSATLLPRARVGVDATVGASSLVVRRVADAVTVFGVPALVISGGSR